VLLNRISYDYSSQGKEESYKAESWITDKYTVNKKRTRLFPITGKFRRKTIDRKNEIFERITATVKK
jgi:colicin import membrane protein